MTVDIIGVKITFPTYKANRKVDRKKSEYNWDLIFETLNTIRDEIRRELSL